MYQNNEVVAKLSQLYQLDYDAVRAYQQAIEACEHEPVRAQLRLFQADHERHIRELGEHIVKYGGTPPARKPDMKGFLIEGMTAIRSLTGTAGALKAMDTNEMLTNRTYEAALKANLPDECRALCHKNLADEQRHLAWIRDAIQRQVWNQGSDLHAP